MKPASAALLLTLILTACYGENKIASSGLPWQPLATVDFDDADGQTPPTGLSAINQQPSLRQSLRVSAAADQCFQVTSAISRFGEELSRPFARSFCPDCGWRTSVIHGSGLLVLEGPAAQLAEITFGRVDCDTFSALATTGTVTIESLTTPTTTNPGIELRLLITDAIGMDIVTDADIDTSQLTGLVAAELGLAIRVTNTKIIAASDLLLTTATDILPLREVLAGLPQRREGIIDVVIGPCLEQSTAFGTQRLAGITPRIPGGAGAADAVFIAQRNCGSRNDSPGDADEIARLVAHELGHYLGLQHPQEADGTGDDFTSTDSNNLMHREPLLATATGLTGEQRARMLAHPFVHTL